MGKHFTKRGKFLERDFNIIHALHDTGKSLAEIKELTGWGGSTISVSARSETYEEYKDNTVGRLNRRKERLAQEKEAKPEPKPDSLGLESDAGVNAIVNLGKEIAGLNKSIKWVGKVLKGL